MNQQNQPQTPENDDRRKNVAGSLAEQRVTDDGVVWPILPRANWSRSAPRA